MSATGTQAQSWRDWLSVHETNKIFPPMSPEKLAALGWAMLAKQARSEKPIPEKIVLFYNGERPSLAVTNMPGWWRQKTHLAKLSVGDGCSRLDAAEKYLGINWFEECATFIRIEYLKGENAVDPWAFSFDANFRRRHLKPSLRREVIAEYRKRRPDLSDNAIAKELDVSPTTVASVTKELEAKGEVSKMETRIGRDGKKQASRKVGKPKPEDAGKQGAKVEAVNKAVEEQAAEPLAERALGAVLDMPPPTAEPPVQLQVEPAAAAAASIFSHEDRRQNFIGALAVLTAEDLEWARKKFNEWLEDTTPKTAAA
jgi:DNA-binding Lrp family transcriptional regulator